MSSAPPILYLQDIHLTYGVTPLLEGAALSVGQGARLCLVGRNGSGKSTLLRIAAGLTDADSGERFVQPRFKIVGLDFILDPIGAPVKAALAPSAQVQHGFAQGL